MESYTTTSKHSTNTSTACDTPSIKVSNKVDETDIDKNTSTMLLQPAC